MTMIIITIAVLAQKASTETLFKFFYVIIGRSANSRGFPGVEIPRVATAS